MLEVANQFERDFLTILLNTGARVGEVRALMWSDVDFEQGSIRLWTRKRANGSRRCRLMPMTEAVRQVLMQRYVDKGKEDIYVFVNPETSSMFDRNHHPVKRMTERLCARAEVKKFDLYSLRHFFAQQAIERNGMTLTDVQTLLGHQRATTTDHYLRSINPDLDRLRGLLEGEKRS